MRNLPGRPSVAPTPKEPRLKVLLLPGTVGPFWLKRTRPKS